MAPSGFWRNLLFISSLCDWHLSYVYITSSTTTAAILLKIPNFRSIFTARSDRLMQHDHEKKKKKVETAVIIIKKKVIEIIYIFVFSWTSVFRNEPLDHSKHRHSF